MSYKTTSYYGLIAIADLNCGRYIGSQPNTIKSEYFNVDVEGRYGWVAPENFTSNIGYHSVSGQPSSLSVNNTYEEVSKTQYSNKGQYKYGDTRV